MGTQVDEAEILLKKLTRYICSKINSYKCLEYGIDRDDLLQEIYIRIWKVYKSDIKNIKYFNSYLNSIVLSVYINEINKIKKEKKTLESGISAVTENCSRNMKTKTSEEQLKEVIMASINEIKYPKRDVIKLRLEGFSFNEISKLNKWTYRKCCNMFYRGMKELKLILREKGIYYENQP